MRMKPLCFGLVGAVALASAVPVANAADIYNKGPSLKEPPAEYLPAIGWTGFYIGANLGAVWPDSNDVDITNDATLIGGGHLGYNWQSPRNVVVGIEGDVDFADGIDYLATVRGRLGYAFGRTLLYGTGGAAFIGVSDNNFDGDNTGWVAGGGLEYKLRDNWSVGAEGLYYSFAGGDISDDLNLWTARARLTYHFGGYRDVLK